MAAVLATTRSLRAALGLVLLSTARGLPEDVTLVQGHVEVRNLGEGISMPAKTMPAKTMPAKTMPAKATGEDISMAAERAAALAAEGAAAETAAGATAAALAAERAAAESMANSTDRSRAAERAEALGTEGMDANTRKMKAAKQKLQQAQKRAAELRARLRELKKENLTAHEKLNRSITKGFLFANRSIHAKLKEEERAHMKGKHVHLDVKKYTERIKQGNLDSYGLWTWDNSKPHFWEKTWDTLSNHIFGLDKLAKNIWNTTEYDQQTRKYAKYEKFFSAKIAAANQEAKEINAALEQANRETEEAEAVIAGAAEAKEASAAQRKKAREELARLKAERKRQEVEDARKEAEDGRKEAEDVVAEDRKDVDLEM